MLAAIAAAVQLAWPRPAPADEHDPVHQRLALQRALVEQARAAAARPALGTPLTVYVDDWRQPATVRDRADRWSHLLADDPAELHAMAAALGIPPPGLPAPPPFRRPQPLRPAREPPAPGHRARAPSR